MGSGRRAEKDAGVGLERLLGLRRREENATASGQHRGPEPQPRTAGRTSAATGAPRLSPVEWSSETAYVFRVDGHETQRVTEGISRQPQYLILSLLTADWEAGQLDRAQLPNSMDVDWVRVWQTDAGCSCLRRSPSRPTRGDLRTPYYGIPYPDSQLSPGSLCAVSLSPFERMYSGRFRHLIPALLRVPSPRIKLNFACRGLGILALFAAAVATSAAADLSFNRDVRPILSDKCFACHGFDPKARKADRRLDTPEGATAEIEGVRALVPGDLKKSDAWQRIVSE